MNVSALNFTKILVLHDKFITIVKLTNQVQYRNLVSKKASAFFFMIILPCYVIHWIRYLEQRNDQVS